MNKPADVNINESIDLKWADNKPRIYVAGKPFLYCSFLIASLDTSDPATGSLTIEDIADKHGARRMEGIDVIRQGLLTPDEVMFGFASSLKGWVETGYNSEALHANLSFPLLKELAKTGDEKARRALQSEISRRIALGHVGAMVSLIDTCRDVLDMDDYKAMARHPGAWVAMTESKRGPVLSMLANYLVEYITAFNVKPDQWVEFVRACKAAYNTLSSMAEDDEHVTEYLLRSLPRIHRRIIDVFKDRAAENLKSYASKEEGIQQLLLAQKIADNKRAPADVLEKLHATYDEEIIYKGIASNPNTPEAVLRLLASDRSFMVRAAVVHNPNVMEDIIKQLSDDESKVVRRAIVSIRTRVVSPVVIDNIVKAELAKPIREQEDEILRTVAENPRAFEETLELLVAHEKATETYSTMLSEYIATNPASASSVRGLSAGKHLLERLAHHPDARVRLCVLDNPVVHSHTLLANRILHLLSNDNNGVVADKARALLVELGLEASWISKMRTLALR